MRRAARHASAGRSGAPGRRMESANPTSKETLMLKKTQVTLTGGAAVAEMFRRYGVGPIFGMGGFQLLPFYEACRQLGMKHTLINDERCGAFAADAYARVTNRVGVVDATLGPGATNL